MSVELFLDLNIINQSYFSQTEFINMEKQNMALIYKIPTEQVKIRILKPKPFYCIKGGLDD